MEKECAVPYTYAEIKGALFDLGWTAYFVFLYHISLFRTISGSECIVSKIFLWGLIILFWVLRSILRRNASAMIKIIFLVLPLGIYSMIAYYIFFKTFITIILILISIGCSGYLVFLTFLLIQKKRRKYTARLLVKKYILGLCIVTAIGSSAVMAPLMVKSWLGSPTLTASADTMSSVNEEYTLEKQMLIAAKLFNGSWGNLSIDERLNVAQVISNIEANYLGLPYRLIVCAESMESDLLAGYDERTHRININVEHLMENEPEAILDTICHEAYHAYTYELIYLFESVEEEQKNLMVFNQVPEYKKEFAFYISPEDDGDYSGQKVELDARRYAEYAVVEYKSRIMRYLENNTREQSKKSQNRLFFCF